MAFRITDSCRSCGRCIEGCPADAIQEGDIYVIDENKCLGCGACVGYCPADAIVEV